jgi:hypothetical protein
MIRKIVCKNERSIKFFIVFGIFLFMTLLGVGGAFVYESFRDGNEPAMIGISISLSILVFCVFLPSFVYCRCESSESSNEYYSSESDSEYENSNSKNLKQIFLQIENFV